MVLKFIVRMRTETESYSDTIDPSSQYKVLLFLKVYQQSNKPTDPQSLTVNRTQVQSC
jgi:hypothetical protein